MGHDMDLPHGLTEQSKETAQPVRSGTAHWPMNAVVSGASVNGSAQQGYYNTADQLMKLQF